MAAQRPASKSAEVTPTPAATGEVASAPVTTDPTLAAPDSAVPATTAGEPPTAAVVAEVPVDVVAAPTVVPAEAAQPAQPVQQVVYVEAPKPFVAKGNRGFGVLIALLATVIYAVLYAVADVIVQLVDRRSIDFSFATTLDFYAPVLLFAVGFILLVLILNRAGWAAYVVGSLLVGVVVFFGATGVILLLHINQIPSNEVGLAFSQVLFDIGSIIAALLAREVALWLGFLVASRGRKVRARNVDARVLYDQEIAAKRAEYEQANARTAAAEPVVAEPVAAEPAVSEPVAAPAPSESVAP